MMGLIAPLLTLVLLGGEARTVGIGKWGGTHAALTVRADGAAIEFDCARGKISGKIPLTAKGEFEVRGWYTPERGGPVRKDEPKTQLSVKYRGTVRDNTLTLEAVDEAGSSLGTFVVSRGAQARLVKCR